MEYGKGFMEIHILVSGGRAKRMGTVSIHGKQVIGMKENGLIA